MSIESIRIGPSVASLNIDSISQVEAKETQATQQQQKVAAGRLLQALAEMPPERSGGGALPADPRSLG